VVITCDPDNWASRKTCIKLGCELERTVDVPRRIQTRWLISERKCRYIWRMNSRMDIE
jgi:predicted acetyltransferase